MTQSDYITIIGTIITILSMIVTIAYAQKAKRYKEQIRQDIRKINLSNIVETLKKSQEEIRKLPKNSITKRGVNIDLVFDSIQEHFDNSLNLLDSDGPDRNIRDYINKAQHSFNSYQSEFANGQYNTDTVVLITESVQSAISKANTKILFIDKG